LQFVDVRVLFLARQELDAHGADLVVHFGVVDDLTKNIEGLVREHFSGSVGKVYGALDTIAKAELFREFDGQVIEGDLMSVGPHSLD